MRAPRPIRVTLFDEHLMCIESLCAALEDADLIIDTTTTVRDELPELVDRRRPDVCLIDIMTPDAASVAVIAATARRAPDTRIATLVNQPTPSFVQDAIDAGVRGFARKDGTLSALRLTLERVADGQRLVGADAVRPVVPAPAYSMSPGSVLEQLTARENEVLERMIAGDDTRHIATALHISRSTARTHVQNVRQKLGARTRLQAVTLAVGHPQEMPRLRRPSLAG